MAVSTRHRRSTREEVQAEKHPTFVTKPGWAQAITHGRTANERAISPPIVTEAADKAVWHHN